MVGSLMRLTPIGFGFEVAFPTESQTQPRKGNPMKRNPGNQTRFQLKPLKVSLTEAEILADLQYGVGDRSRPERAIRRGNTTR